MSAWTCSWIMVKASAVVRKSGDGCFSLSRPISHPHSPRVCARVPYFPGVNSLIPRLYVCQISTSGLTVGSVTTYGSDTTYYLATDSEAIPTPATAPSSRSEALATDRLWNIRVTMIYIVYINCGKNTVRLPSETAGTQLQFNL